MFGWRRCFQETASLQNLCTSLNQYWAQRWGSGDAHAEGIVEFLRNVDACDFNGNLSAFEFALMYRGWSLVLLQPCVIFAIALEFHRVGDQLMCTAELVQFAEFSLPFFFRHGTIFKILIVTLEQRCGDAAKQPT